MIHRIAAVGIWFVAVVLLTSCVLRAPDPNRIGTLQIDGPNGFLSDQRVAHTQPLMINDHVATGSGTSARITFLQGAGFVQLDENTDPWFLLEASGCIIVKMVHGQLYADAKRLCIQGDDLSLAMGSRINLWSDGKNHELTVIQGRVEVSRPVSQVVQSGQRLRLTAGRAAPVVNMTLQEVGAGAWRQRYFTIRVPKTAVEPPPTPPAPAPTPSPRPGIEATVMPGWCCDASWKLSKSNSLQCARIKGSGALPVWN